MAAGGRRCGPGIDRADRPGRAAVRRRGAGLAAIPGYATVRHTLAGVRWPWLLVSLGGVAAALAGYLLAWRGIARGGVGGGSLSRRQQFAAVPPHHCERKGKVMATRKTGFGGAPALCPPTTATLPEALSVAFSERDASDIRRSGRASRPSRSSAEVRRSGPSGRPRPLARLLGRLDLHERIAGRCPGAAHQVRLTVMLIPAGSPSPAGEILGP